jgi:hypothetical protein
MIVIYTLPLRYIGLILVNARHLLNHLLSLNPSGSPLPLVLWRKLVSAEVSIIEVLGSYGLKCLYDD